MNRMHCRTLSDHHPALPLPSPSRRAPPHPPRRRTHNAVLHRRATCTHRRPLARRRGATPGAVRTRQGDSAGGRHRHPRRRPAPHQDRPGQAAQGTDAERGEARAQLCIHRAKRKTSALEKEKTTRALPCPQPLLHPLPLRNALSPNSPPGPWTRRGPSRKWWNASWARLLPTAALKKRPP